MAFVQFTAKIRRTMDAGVQVSVGIKDASDDVVRSAISDALFHAVDKLGEWAVEPSALTETPRSAPVTPNQIVYAFEGDNAVELTRSQWWRVQAARVAAGRILTRDEVLAIVADEASQ